MNDDQLPHRSAESGGIDSASDQAAQWIPVACTLDQTGQQRRGREITELLRAGGREVRPLLDGYAVRFAGDAIWAERLLRFILHERTCCPFFKFELEFLPGPGPIWLRLRGPEGTTDFVHEVFAQAE